MGQDFLCEVHGFDLRSERRRRKLPAINRLSRRCEFAERQSGVLFLSGHRLTGMLSPEQQRQSQILNRSLMKRGRGQLNEEPYEERVIVMGSLLRSIEYG